MDHQVASVVVTYDPDPGALQNLVSLLKKQTDWVLLVDNFCGKDSGTWLTESRFRDVRILRLSRNVGLGAAQNIAIEMCRELGCTHVMLVDQDSRPAPDMVRRLLQAYEKSSILGNVAAVGPRYVDKRFGNISPFIHIQGFRLKRRPCRRPGDIVPVDFLIASGMLIPMEVLDVVGTMREDLFIDYVDTEWCFRASKAGYKLYGVCDALMEHELGKDPIKIAGKTWAVRSPLRHYYLVRNAVSLYREKWVPLRWKFVDGYRLLVKFVVYSVLAKPRLKHLKMMSAGFWHGLVGRLGSFEQACTDGTFGNKTEDETDRT